MEAKYPLVEIRWDDAASLEHGWVDPEQEKPVAQMVTTVGFLIADDSDYVVIASTTDGTWVNGRFQIPRGMVRKIRPLRRPRKPKAVAGASA